MTVNLGIIPIIDRGLYDPDHSYRPLDLVHYDNRIYLVRECCKETPVTDTSYYAEVHVEMDPDGDPEYYQHEHCIPQNSRYAMLAVSCILSDLNRGKTIKLGPYTLRQACVVDGISNYQPDWPGYKQL